MTFMTIGKFALEAILARPSSMNNMDDDKIIAAADAAANTNVQAFFEEQITDASVSESKSALAQLALLNRRAA